MANITGRYQLHGAPGLVFLTDLQAYSYSNVQDGCREHLDMVVSDGSVSSMQREFDHCFGPLVKGGDGTGCQYVDQDTMTLYGLGLKIIRQSH